MTAQDNLVQITFLAALQRPSKAFLKQMQQSFPLKHVSESAVLLKEAKKDVR